MNPKKRQILFNILAVRLWIGDRHVALANNLEDALKIDANSIEGKKAEVNKKNFFSKSLTTLFIYFTTIR